MEVIVQCLSGIIEILKEYGPMGLLSGLLIYQVWFLQNRMEKTIKNNTEMLEQLKDSILVFNTAIQNIGILERIDKG